ncbi:MAG TPA: HlyD family efflux transporter periplasmic adaptor subunit [Longimicrobium sp.]
MPNAFSRTTRSLDAARARPWTLTLAFGLALLAAWLLWFALGRVAVYEVSDEARLEVEAAAHPVMPSVGGRVVRSALAIGRQVRRGEVLVELEAEAESSGVAESRARHAGLAARLQALGGEIAAQEAALVTQRSAREAAAREARARAAEAELRAQAAEREAERATRMQAGGLIAEADAERTRAEARARRAAAQALALEAGRLDEDRRVDEGERRARIAELRSQAAGARADDAVEQARLQRLAYEAGQRSIRAPVDGRVGQALELRPGTVVTPGDTLASLVPSGRLRVVAFFPVTSLGRVRPGQQARVRLAGFPWTEFGRLRGRVADVAPETRDGRFRVELSLQRPAGSAIPLAHGLPGSVEVEVERISPAALVLRAAGKGRAAPAAAARAGR